MHIKKGYISLLPMIILFMAGACTHTENKNVKQPVVQLTRENHDSLMTEYCKETPASLFGDDSSAFIDEMKRISSMRYPPDVIMKDYPFMYEIFSRQIYDHYPSLEKYLDSVHIPEYRMTVACLLLYMDTVAGYEYKLGFVANTMSYYYEKNNMRKSLLMNILYEGLRYTNEEWDGFSIKHLGLLQIKDCQKYVYGLVKLIQGDYLADHESIDEVIKMKEELIKDGFLSEYNKFRIGQLNGHKKNN